MVLGPRRLSRHRSIFQDGQHSIGDPNVTTKGGQNEVEDPFSRCMMGVVEWRMEDEVGFLGLQ